MVRVDNQAEIAARVKKAQSSPLMALLPQMRGRLLDGRVEVPADFPPLPIPPDWIAKLTSEQLRTMQIAEGAAFQQRDAAAGRSALSALKAARAPEPAYAAAECDILLMGSDPVSSIGIEQLLIELARKYPEATTASGSPVADLALIRALRPANAGPSGRSPA